MSEEKPKEASEKKEAKEEKKGEGPAAEKGGEGKKGEAEEKKAEAPKPQEKIVEAKAEEKPEAEKEVKKRKPGKLAVVHVYSSKNDTIITATDISGAETLSWASGGMMVKSSREEGKPYAAMQAAQKIVNDLREKGVDTVHIKIRAPGGNGSKTPGGGAQAVVRTIARMKMRVGRIEDVTPIPTDSMKRAGGRRGRRV
jgi:small subunit ribosomal protein S11